MPLRCRWALWYIVLIGLWGWRLCGWCNLPSDLLLLSQNCRIFTGHRTITHILLITISICGWTTHSHSNHSRIIANATAQHLNLNKSKIIQSSNWIQFRISTHIQRMHHSACESFSIILRREIQTIYEFRIAPLMECGRGLIIFETLQYGTVDDDLVILQLTANNAKCVVLLMMIDLHLAEACRRAWW